MNLVCLGDSFTRGFGVKPGESWIDILSTSQNLGKLKLINKGINGDTTSGMLARFASDVISESPRYVLITGGANDLIAGSPSFIPQNNYMALVHQAFAANIVPIIGIEPDFEKEHIRSSWAAFADFYKIEKEFDTLRTFLHSMSRTFGVFLLDFSEKTDLLKNLRSDKRFTSDGLHLLPEAHKIMADTAATFFKQNGFI